MNAATLNKLINNNIAAAINDGVLKQPPELGFEQIVGILEMSKQMVVEMAFRAATIAQQQEAPIILKPNGIHIPPPNRG